jgi:hypothetical protein
MKGIIGAAISLLLMASCITGEGASSSAEASATHPIASPMPNPTATATPCPNPEGGPTNTCLGDIAAGTYHTQTFQPGLRYSVPEGWGNLEDLPGNFLLLPPGATLAGVNPGTSDYIGAYTSVVAPGRCTGQPSEDVPLTFDGLVGWITSNPRVNVTGVHDVSVGGLDGVVMDVSLRAAKGDGCPDGVYADVYVGTGPSSLVHGVIKDYRLRVYLLREHSRTLAIEVADAPGGSKYKRWFDAAGTVVHSFRFTT